MKLKVFLLSVSDKEYRKDCNAAVVLIIWKEFFTFRTGRNEKESGSEAEYE